MGIVTLNRRHFLQGSLALAGLHIAAGCGLPRLPWQPPSRIPRVGFLAPDANGATTAFNEAFRDGLRELGYVEGQTIAIEWRLLDNTTELAGFAAELVHLPVDVIVTRGEVAVRAIKDISSTIPIIMALGGDPVGGGLAASLAHPGGTVTGLVNISPQLSAKRLELLTQAATGLSRVAAFWSPTDKARITDFRETEAAALALQVRLQSLEVRRPEEFEGAFAAALSERAEGLLVFAGPVNASQLSRIVAFAAQQRLPAMYALREYADAGGLLAYGPSYLDMHRRAATYVDKILKGAKPADLPIEQPTVFDCIINLKTAQALGLTIPPTVLQQATELGARQFLAGEVGR